MSTEISVAKQIQLSLLPDEIGTIHPDFEISAGIVTAPGVAGDYYDISIDCNGSLWLGIGDVAGHGLTAGLIMMIAQTVHTTLTTHYKVSAQDIIMIANQVFYNNVNQRMGDTRFMTMTQLKYLGNGRFQHAGLHQEIIVYRRNIRACQSIETSGMWLNIVPEIKKYTQNNEFTVNRGDILILFTNGLTNVMHNSAKMLDIAGL